MTHGKQVGHIEREAYMHVMKLDVFVFVAVMLLLFFVYLLPPCVKQTLEMSGASHPVTWLTNNYVHEDWNHLANNLQGFAGCMLIYFVLVTTLAVLGYDPRWLKGFSLVIHLGGLVIIPILSSFTYLHLKPQGYMFGFSLSVSAYFGAYAALWALATAEVLGIGKDWRTIYTELQLFLLLLTPIYRYLTSLVEWLTLATTYIPLVSSAQMVLLAIRSPRSLHKFFEGVPLQVKEPKKTGIVLLGLLLIIYPLIVAYFLHSFYPVSTMLQVTGGQVNWRGHLVSMVAGYFLTCLYIALAHNQRASV
jgi:hypothetical protein